MEWIKASQIDKNIIYEGKKLKKKIQTFAKKKICCPDCLPSLVFSLFGHNFCSRAPIEIKIIFPRSSSVFLSSIKFSKNQDRNSARRYLPEIWFVPRTDNGLLGVKKLVCIHLPKDLPIRQEILFLPNDYFYRYIIVNI